MIHVFRIAGENIVIDVPGGSIHCVDETTADILSSFQKMFFPEDLKEAFGAKYPAELLDDIFAEIKLYMTRAVYIQRMKMNSCTLKKQPQLRALRQYA